MLDITGAGTQPPMQSHWKLRPGPQSHKNSKQQCKRYRANTATANSKASATRQTAPQPRPVPPPHRKRRSLFSPRRWRRRWRALEEFLAACVGLRLTRPAQKSSEAYAPKRTTPRVAPSGWRGKLPSTARSGEWPRPGFPLFFCFFGRWRALAKGTAWVFSLSWNSS